MKKRKRKYNAIKVACQIDREREIKTHGKIVSLRPSSVHKSKKTYSRKGRKFSIQDYEND